MYMNSAIKKLFAAIVVAAGLQPVSGQVFKPVDYTALNVDISFNPTAYDTLLSRFENGDASLDVTDMSTVYYGFVCSPGYNPDVDCHDVVTALEESRWDDAYDLAVKALEVIPVSLDMNTKAVIAATNSTDPDVSIHVARLSARVDMLVMAILSSGLGTIPEAPFFVTSYDDALSLVKGAFGATAILGRSSVGPVDAIKFTLDDTGREHILYFNTYHNTKQKNTNSSI